MPVGSVLFAAGRGKRLRPLTDVVAKPVVPLLDVPLGGFALSRLVQVCPPVLVNANHLSKQIFATFRALAGDAVQELLEEPDAYGSGGTLAAVQGRVEARVVTWNSDVLTDLDPAELLATHARSGALATLAVAPVPELADFELGEGRIGRLVNRHRESVPGARFIGAAVFEKAALALLPDRRPFGLTEALIGPLIERGEAAYLPHDGYLRDVGNIDEYLGASRDLIDGRGPVPPGPYPGRFVEVDGGRAYVGPGAEADERSLGPYAAVLAGAAVPADARVANAVVLPGEVVAAEARVEAGIWLGNHFVAGDA